MRVGKAFLFCFVFIVAISNISNGITRNDSLFVPHAHVIKMRAVFPVLVFFYPTKILGFSYEYVISKKRSFNLAADLGRTYDNSIYSGRISWSDGLSLYPEYRFYPFNKRKVYPRGFFISPSLNFGFLKGRNEIYSQIITQTSTSISSNIVKTGSSDFRVITVGAGGLLGWQYFLGKRKRLTMSVSLGVYANKNFILYESVPISEHNRMYRKKNDEPIGYFATYLGYTFGKKESKK